jgi:hypothetical protein
MDNIPSVSNQDYSTDDTTEVESESYDIEEMLQDDWGEIKAATAQEVQELRNALSEIIADFNNRLENHKEVIENHCLELGSLKADRNLLIKEAGRMRQELTLLHDQAKEVVVRHALEDWEASRMWVVKKLDRIQSKIRNRIRLTLTWLAEKV